MIIICEPLCRNFSHEKVNSGFLTALSLAYPEETLCLHAHLDHIEALKSILLHDSITLNNIQYVPTKFGETSGIFGWMMNFFIFTSIFHNSIRYGNRKLFFLSYNASLLFILKCLKLRRCFTSLNFALVLHGSFENIAPKPHSISDIPPAPVIRKPVADRIRAITLKKLALFCKMHIDRRFKFWHFLSKALFQEKKMLLWQHTSAFRYICLAPHVMSNAKKYIDTDTSNMQTLVMPINFSSPKPPPQNSNVKFATFGYGNSKMLYQLLLSLSSLPLKNSYEIRVIGMDSKGTEGFSNVVAVSPGKPLTRADMEAYARDIDIFLILYEKDRYRLSCSGSIFESLSYSKPILHLANECIDAFNRPTTPIGYSCDTIDALAHKMAEIIDSYPEGHTELTTFRENIMDARKTYSIENSVTTLREIFTW